MGLTLRFGCLICLGKLQGQGQQTDRRSHCDACVWLLKEVDGESAYRRR